MKMKSLIFVLFPLFLQGQVLLYNETFENGSNGWNTCYPAQHNNNWAIGTLAGNGTSSTGINSAFVTIDGTASNYTNSTLGDEKIVFYKQFNTTGYTNGFIFSFDWKGYGEYTDDALYVCICFSNPTFITNWFQTSSAMCLTPAWTTETWYLASPTIFNNNAALKIGIMFKCNNTTVNQPSFAFDNFRLIANQSPLGIDTTTIVNHTYQESEKRTYKYYNLAGKQIKTPQGYVIRVDEYGNKSKLYIQ